MLVVFFGPEKANTPLIVPHNIVNEVMLVVFYFKDTEGQPNSPVRSI